MLAAVLIAIFIFGFGYKTGGNSVRVEYQNAINVQKAEADKIIQENIAFVQKSIKDNETIKSTLEKERQANVKTTNDLRTQLANNGLRFKSNQCGASSTNTMPAKDNTASNTETASIELPAKITASLRELAYDCDTLRDDYTLLHNFLQETK